MVKTVSEDCNLACDYCYCSRVKGRPQTIRTPADVVRKKATAGLFPHMWSYRVGRMS